MILSTVTFTVTPGRNLEAAEYFRAVAAASTKLTGVEMKVHVSLLGQSGQFMLISAFDSMRVWDEARLKGSNDRALQKMIADASKSGLFVPGSIYRTVWEQV